MSGTGYASNFAAYIEKYIQFKCSIGYSKSSYLRRMGQFDRFCAQNFPDAETVSEEVVLSWCRLQGGESENNRTQRMVALKGPSRATRKEDAYAQLKLSGHPARL